MRRFTLHLSILGFAAALVGLFWWYSGQGDPTFADAGDVTLVARGEKVYVDHCAACHGENLEGQPQWRRRKADGRLPAPPHDESGHTWHHSDQQLFQITKQGSAAIAGPDYKSDMAAFGDVLSDTKIWAVLAYIKSRWPETIRRRSVEINKRTR